MIEIPEAQTVLIDFEISPEYHDEVLDFINENYLKIKPEYFQNIRTIKENLKIENQTVLDPMMETGTTSIAALRLNRKFIRIEKNPKTFETAKVRINKQEFEKRIK